MSSSSLTTCRSWLLISVGRGSQPGRARLEDLTLAKLLGPVKRPVGLAGKLSISAGIADLLPDDNPTGFFERADEALYRAKELGKGQVFQAGTPGLSAAPDASQQPGTASSQ